VLQLSFLSVATAIHGITENQFFMGN
jgi:hypothetical protein